MSVKSLGRVTIEGNTILQFVLAKKDSNSSKESTIPSIKLPGSFKLGSKHYLPLTVDQEIDHSENSPEETLSLSKKIPQPIGEVDKFGALGQDPALNKSMENRLWLYGGKIYLFNRNDYDKRLVHLLILEYLDKEKARFSKLEKKYRQVPEELAGGD